MTRLIVPLLENEQTAHVMHEVSLAPLHWLDQKITVHSLGWARLTPYIYYFLATTYVRLRMHVSGLRAPDNS